MNEIWVQTITIGRYDLLLAPLEEINIVKEKLFNRGSLFLFQFLRGKEHVAHEMNFLSVLGLDQRSEEFVSAFSECRPCLLTTQERQLAKVRRKAQPLKNGLP